MNAIYPIYSTIRADQKKDQMQTLCGITTDGMLDYLAAIYTLGEYATPATNKITTTSLAEKMHVSPAAASSMLKRLEDSGFVDRSGSGGVLLTEQGTVAALQLLRRHRLLEVFLMQVMGFTWDQVAVEASRMEHSVSAKFEERMDQLCGYPTHCPHGDPIPTKNGELRQEKMMCVLELEPGDQGILHRIGTNDARVLRYLSRLHLIPGRPVQLLEKAPFNGPVTLKLSRCAADSETGTFLNGFGADDVFDEEINASQILGNELAEQLFVVPA